MSKIIPYAHKGRFLQSSHASMEPDTRDGGQAGDTIDWKVVEQLRSRRRDGRTVFARLLPVFTEEAQQALSELKFADSPEVVKHVAHKLKGSASVLGSIEVRDHSQDILDQAAKGNLPGVDEVQELEQAIVRFCDFANQLAREG